MTLKYPSDRDEIDQRIRVHLGQQRRNKRRCSRNFVCRIVYSQIAGRTVFKSLLPRTHALQQHRDAVLLLTHSGDFYTVDLVSQALARRGVRPIRFNTDLFPSSVKLSARAGDERAAHLFTETGEQISAAEVRAVWARKLWSPRMADDLDERYRSMCVEGVRRRA